MREWKQKKDKYTITRKRTEVILHMRERKCKTDVVNEYRSNYKAVLNVMD